MARTISEPTFSELVFGFVYPVGINADPVLNALQELSGPIRLPIARLQN